MYDARAVANYFLYMAKRDGKCLDPMQVQKLVYFAHGWNLATTNEPLISERVEAWQYGPVIPSLYHAFKKYGNGPIKNPAMEAKITDGGWISLGWSSERPLSIDDSEQSEQNRFTKQLLERVWASYGGFSGIQLSNITHEAASPWQQVWKNTGTFRNAAIGDDVIREYFLNKTRLHEKERV